MTINPDHLSEKRERDLMAIARGYRAMLDDALAGLLRIADECDTRDQMHTAAEEALRAVGVDRDV